MTTPRGIRAFALFCSLVLASPAVAALTKAQQQCVSAQNQSWQKITATFGKLTSTCIGIHNKDLVDIVSCVPDIGGDKLDKAFLKAVDAYDKRCFGLDGDGQPKEPDVFSSAGDFIFVTPVEGLRMLGALYGVDIEAAATDNLENKPAASCQAAVAKTVLKCADLRRKTFNACKKNALAAGKDPFPLGAETPAELATCYGVDPKGALAKTCDGPEDKIRAEIGNKCVDKGVGLAVAFPQCGASDVDGVHTCLDAPARCAVCKGVSGMDRLSIDCDTDDDGLANGSCARLEMLVPAYANPCCDDGPAMWTGLATAAAAGTTKLHVILNPASGPGTGPEIDPNYVNADPAGPLLDVRAAGAVIYGYVSTSFATRPIGAAKADIDLYYTPAYWRGAGVQVDGIFLDEMSSDLPDVGYYQELRDYVKAKDANARVIANPGQPGTQDTSGGSSGFTVMDYATAADVLVTFEGTSSDYELVYTPPAWANALPASHFAHLIHEASGVLYLELDIARTRKVGMVYVTDDVFTPNPWDTLPSYFMDEVEDMSLLP